MRRDSEGLTIRQRRFVDALQGCGTVTEACKLAKVSLASGYRWVGQAAVQAALDAERRRVLDKVADGILQALGPAFKASGELIGNTTEPALAVRGSVALGIINAALKLGGLYDRRALMERGGTAAEHLGVFADLMAMYQSGAPVEDQ